jgi:ribosomal protein RSM22 (predicted rRNA methylase)
VLPQPLKIALENCPYTPSELSRGHHLLTQAYQEGLRSPFDDPVVLWAYILARMPATYKACFHVFSSFKDHIEPDVSILDVGTGPGTALWAWYHTLGFSKAHALEVHHTMKVVAEKIWEQQKFEEQESPKPSVSWGYGSWPKNDLFKDPSTPYDWVIGSYVLNEWPEDQWLGYSEKLWDHATEGIILIDPGTPRSFQRLKTLRSHLQSMGGYTWAPCGHDHPCPLASDDWCHFSLRLDRSSLHRHIKGGLWGHEDEKFSYLVMGRKPFLEKYSRIIKRPHKEKKHIHFALCDKDGSLTGKTLTKSSGETYRECKKYQWGDIFPNLEREKD